MATLLRPQAPQAFDEPSVSFSFKTFMDPLWHVAFDRMQFRNSAATQPAARRRSRRTRTRTRKCKCSSKTEVSGGGRRAGERWERETSSKAEAWERECGECAECGSRGRGRGSSSKEGGLFGHIKIS